MIYQTLFCNGFNGFISFQSLGYSWRNRICLRKVCCNEVVKAMKKTANTMRQWLVQVSTLGCSCLGLNRLTNHFQPTGVISCHHLPGKDMVPVSPEHRKSPVVATAWASR
jgi:hypothetical protein